MPKAERSKPGRKVQAPQRVVRARSSRAATPLDLLVGANIRRERVARGITLADFGAQLGLSHQQVQKYETGANRVSAGTLISIAAVLHLPVEALMNTEDESGEGRGGRALETLRDRARFLIARASDETTLRQMVGVLEAIGRK